MKSAFGTVFLAVSTLFSLFTSGSSFLNPAEFGRRLGFLVPGVDGLNEIRAQYGGFFLALAIVDGLVLGGVFSRRTGYVINAAVFGGLFAGRLVSLLADGGFQRYGGVIGALFFIDGAGLVLSIASLFLDDRT